MSRNNTLSPKRIIAILALTLLVIAVAWLGWRLHRIYAAATALRADLHAAQALADRGLQAADLEQAAVLLRDTRGDLDALQSAARPFLALAPHLAWIPRYGPTIHAAPAFLHMAVQVTDVGETLARDLLPLLEDPPEAAPSGDASVISQAAAVLAGARPQLDEALTAVQRAREARQAIDARALHPRLESYLTRLDRYLPLLEQGMQSAALAPELLGADRPRTYLLLVQNEDELRATGGFISGVARVTIDRGDIEEIAFEDSYAVDDFSQPYPEPPAPLRDIMLADLWVFRDSNWSPDFPTAARQAVELYTLTRDADIDGVIGLDQRAVSLLLGPLGPLQVEGADRPVTGQNVLQVARQAWAPGEEIGSDWWGQRKDIMGSVLDAAVRHFKRGLQRDQMIELAYAALKALGEKHMLVYLPDPAAVMQLRERGWDGALAEPEGDYLMVVDTNMGFNKVNAVVEQSLHYAVDLTDPADPRATLTVHHRHPVAGWTGPCDQTPRYDATYEEMTRRCYYDYLRVYAAPGARLVQATPHSIPASILLSGERQAGDVEVSSAEDGKTTLATFLVVSPGEDLRTTFVYSLPGDLVEQHDGVWHYTLTVQKQPGTDANPITVTLQLPAGANVAHIAPTPSAQQSGRLEYELDLRTDLTLDVGWTLQEGS